MSRQRRRPLTVWRNRSRGTFIGVAQRAQRLGIGLDRRAVDARHGTGFLHQNPAERRFDNPGREPFGREGEFCLARWRTDVRSEHALHPGMADKKEYSRRLLTK